MRGMFVCSFRRCIALSVDMIAGSVVVVDISDFLVYFVILNPVLFYNLHRKFLSCCRAIFNCTVAFVIFCSRFLNDAVNEHNIFDTILKKLESFARQLHQVTSRPIVSLAWLGLNGFIPVYRSLLYLYTVLSSFWGWLCTVHFRQLLHYSLINRSI